MKNIDMIIITYAPEIELLTKAIQSMVQQVRRIYIVDNTPTRADSLKIFQDKFMPVVILIFMVNHYLSNRRFVSKI